MECWPIRLEYGGYLALVELSVHTAAMKVFRMSLIVLCFLSLIARSASADAPLSDPAATKLVEEAIEYWREKTSQTVASMTIHRPEWERSMKMKSWTKGLDLSLIKFIGPPKDAGSASLKIANEMWSYSPKINRVIKIPSSMMAQSWMGSDFSYNDLARDNDIIEHYHHQFLPEETHEGRKVFVVLAIPKEDAPVVWGKEIVKVRDDKVLLEHLFFDQEMKLVKAFKTISIADFGGKIFPKTMRMTNVEKEDEWTEITHHSITFGIELPENLFTISYLKNPRLQ
ncbi:MAG: outer membrane lipoprotein-sorting protein [Bdellovibrionales bacterium]|nr:outer membrane lipoprotein-sorting protein [Bdellovibrionales bacterium]